jgi:hypothetical protein
LLAAEAAVIVGSAFIFLLAASELAKDGPSPVQAELDACAERIEALKSRQEIGRELDRLLRRAQQLAAELERTRASLPGALPAAPAVPLAPSAEELRERADAWRDEADRVAAEIAAIDVRIQDAHLAPHGARPAPADPVARAALGSAGRLRDGSSRLRALAAERAKLVELRIRAEAEAARLDGEARAADALEGVP